jgi:hypothetical protein
MERLHLEAGGLEEAAHLAPRERELIELAAAHLRPSRFAREPGPGQAPHSVPVGHREKQDPARGQHPLGLGHDGGGSRGIVLDDAQREIRGGAPVAHPEGAQVHGRERRARPRALAQRLQTPVRADGGSAALAQQQHVLPQPAPRLENDAARGQMPLDERGERRAARHLEEGRHRMAPPVLAPELRGGGARVVRERHG